MKERTDLEIRQKEERNEQRKNGLVLSRTVNQLCFFFKKFFIITNSLFLITNILYGRQRVILIYF
jgi:hypothetical protein